MSSHAGVRSTMHVHHVIARMPSQLSAHIVADVASIREAYGPVLKAWHCPICSPCNWHEVLVSRLQDEGHKSFDSSSGSVRFATGQCHHSGVSTHCTWYCA